MKAFYRLITIILIFSFNIMNAQEFYSVSGKVLDASSKRQLSYASIQLISTNISNVTNSEGNFILKVPVNLKSDTLLVSYLGYKTQKIVLKPGIDQRINIMLNPSEIDLKPITIRPQDPYELVMMAINRIDRNYHVDHMQVTAFYREMIKKGGTYVSINEAVLDINKSAYGSFRMDQIGIYKARGNYDSNRIDTLMVKFQGGPHSALEIDVASDPFLGVEPIVIKEYYDFKMVAPVTIDNKYFYVIEFDQKPYLTDILFRGRLYIESESMAFARIEFNMNVEDNPRANSFFIRKKPSNLKMDVVSAAYLVNYKEINGIWHFDYSRTEVKFNAKWDKRWFRNTYTITSELASTEISDRQRKIENLNRIKSKDIMSNKVQDFTDENFWGAYNIIEPDASIESVISRIIRQLNKRDKDL
ncbi:carboxypeptidase-like regulatory domain-containing protein [Bacteroidales bacterium MB20-C3-3]|nr:carboxypeptidase-like regulatory domain-containing protein [Bacteroidales bacterium]MBP8677718.1 carboxypeptidase-like regulatory domain-containing protein [Bacteroidales bacterium]MBP9584498.1 carboxypeptidase-like regulatory domain-containing protein [Bacteroidales bacterium]MBP9977861.1 carboxypeptidase-like regulatory domain-containing protein [Bacteroidales bacterium]WRQ33320.1 carboxypeptidase-like regulatory domain-containing protein [Bacteroidales bacterium MB20-C3-3]